MKYVGLLRGINVGGNTLVKMSDLKKAVENCGYDKVLTYINSGNVIFETDQKDSTKITETLEKEFAKTLHHNLRVVVRSHSQLQKIVDEIPSLWKKNTDVRCYIAFVKEPVTPDVVIAEITCKEGIDFVHEGNGVVYMSTLLTGITNSGFAILAAKKIYKDITIRNYNTVQKILALM